MDGILVDGRTGKLWLCERHGHALGMIMTVPMNGRFVEGLLLFREAVRVGKVNGNETVMLPLVQTKGFLEGTMHNIECELCDHKRTWWMDSKIVTKLIAPLYGGE